MASETALQTDSPQPRVGFLHPGQMGSAMARQVDADARWCPAGRSPQTESRAQANGLTAVATLAELVATSDVIVSICPPDSADVVAGEVAELGFDGIYCDANAIAPALARSIGSRFENYVDGGVVGPPPTRPGAARLYLSGGRADEIAALWEGSNLEPVVLGDEPGAASALKMTYAAWTKGSSALLLAIQAVARAEGVDGALIAEWERSQPALVDRADGARRGVTPKAWRFAGEMQEIAATFSSAGLPDGFHAAAADVYRRLADFKNADPAPDVDAVLAALLQDRG